MSAHNPTDDEESNAPEPRSGLAKLLHSTEPDTPLDEVAAKATQRTRYRCPQCGWTAEIHRTTCFVCDYDEQLEPVQGGVDEASP